MTGNSRDPFVNCFYTPLLSVADYYNLNIFQIIINPFFRYEYVPEIAYPTGYLSVKSESLIDLNIVLDSVGIEIIHINSKLDDLFDVIRECIDNNSPVLVHIDMYYQAGRRDNYYKKHDGSHYVFVYGYNDFDETVYVLDDVKGYDEYIISYKDLSIYYQGLFDFCNLSYETNATIHKFQKKESSIHNVDDISQIKNFALPMIQNKADILNGLEELNGFIELQHSVKNDLDVISVLNNNILHKQSEKYQYIFLDEYNFYTLDYKSIIQNSLDVIVENWIIIRSIITMNLFRGRVYSSQIQNSVISSIEEIYNNEKTLHSHLFEILEKWTA